MSDLRKPVSLQMIADRVGVSVSMVSKVLNNHRGASTSRTPPITASQIRATARELGYRKNHAAAALVRGRQSVIGGFLHAVGVPGSGITEQVVRGLADGAARRNHRLMLRFFETVEQFMNYMPEVSPTLLDGVIMAGVVHPELLEQFRELEAAGVPVVGLHDCVLPDPAPVNVYVLQRRVGQLATDHLVGRGCRRIATISIDPARTEGYRLALAGHGLEADPALVFPASSYTAAMGELAVTHWASRGVRYDGIVAQSDQQAVGAINALMMRGIQVPGEVKVIGVDDSPLCETSIVPLSSVSNEYYARGVIAVDSLLDRIEGRPVRNVEVEPVLKPRASSLGSLPVPFSRPGTIN